MDTYVIATTAHYEVVAPSRDRRRSVNRKGQTHSNMHKGHSWKNSRRHRNQKEASRRRSDFNLLLAKLPAILIKKTTTKIYKHIRTISLNIYYYKYFR